VENRELVLGLYTISEYMYCQRSAFYKFYGFEENAHNKDLIKGKIAHEAVSVDSVRYTTGTKQQTDLKIFSHKYGLSGKLDLLEHKTGKLIPVEYKKGQVTNYPNHRIQLCLEVLCIEEMYATQIDSAYIYFTEANKRVAVEMFPELRQTTINLLNEIKRKLQSGNPTAFAKENNHKCFKCSFYETCMPNVKGEL